MQLGTPVTKSQVRLFDARSKRIACRPRTRTKYAYDYSGNLTNKSDVGAYSYNPGTHQVASITGTVNGVTNPTFSYDANGNLTSEDGVSTTWSSYNMATSLTRGTATDTFQYGPEHERVEEVATTSTSSVTTYYANASFEMVVNATTGVTEYHNYINAGSRRVAMLIDSTNGTTSWRYFQQDHLGSVEVVTDQTGTLVERLSYDAWGRRRNTNGSDSSTFITALDDRGYTDQEELDSIGLINMNGRIYDPTIARFMSADPTVQSPFKLQSHNRYAYVRNRPLSGTDPTGFYMKQTQIPPWEWADAEGDGLTGGSFISSYTAGPQAAYDGDGNLAGYWTSGGTFVATGSSSSGLVTYLLPGGTIIQGPPGLFDGPGITEESGGAAAAPGQSSPANGELGSSSGPDSQGSTNRTTCLACSMIAAGDTHSQQGNMDSFYSIWGMNVAGDPDPSQGNTIAPAVILTNVGVVAAVTGGALYLEGLVGIGEAAEGVGAARGLGQLGGVFTSTTNAAGGTVWTSEGLIVQSDFASLVNSGLYKGEVNILTGVHGLADGTTIADYSLYEADVATFGKIPGVNIYNVPSMTPGQIGSVLNGPGTTIGGFCNSGACLLGP
jgi:RHS repeat-associated protein